MRTPLKALVAFALLLSGFVAGASTTRTAEAQRSPLFDHLPLFAEVLTHIHRLYVEDVDQSTLMQGAVRGLMSGLDPHSAWMTPEEFEAMRADTRGEYVGVGMEIGVEEERLVIRTVFDGGPAARAGLQPGDVLIQIDDASTEGWGVENAVTVLRGERGSPVRLVVERPVGDLDETSEPAQASAPEILSFDLVRDVIQVASVTLEAMGDGLAVAHIRSFQSRTTEELRQALQGFRDTHGEPLRGLVLDLRNNPGGLLREAISISDLFLDNGTVVSTRVRGNQEQDRWQARRSATVYRGPLLVLVNEGSASASEIVAGALQDNQRAVVMGEPTYGKGSVQSIIPLSDGSGLKLTVSLYYTPNGRSIQAEGIEPTLRVPRDAPEASARRQSRESTLARSLRRPEASGDEERPPARWQSVEDHQLRVAFEQLRLFEAFGQTRR